MKILGNFILKGICNYKTGRGIDGKVRTKHYDPFGPKGTQSESTEIMRSKS